MPPAPARAAADVRGMFDRIARRYDAANRVMSAGIDVLWRRRAMRSLLDGLGPEPAVLDLGAGTLDGALEILRRRPRARVAAADFARRMLEVGRRKRGADRVTVLAADGMRLPVADAGFDAAFTAFCVRNLPDVSGALAELRRVLRPGAPLVVLEFFRPVRRRLFFDRVWNARALPFLGWAVTGDRAAYRYLPASIESFLGRSDFQALARAAGFPEVAGEDLFPAGVASLVVAR